MHRVEDHFEIIDAFHSDWKADLLEHVKPMSLFDLPGVHILAGQSFESFVTGEIHWILFGIVPYLDAAITGDAASFYRAEYKFYTKRM